MRKQRHFRNSSLSAQLAVRSVRRARRFSLPEKLESRTLLSAYVVSSNADDGSTGTLRDAITQVNAGLYNEIDFAGPMTIAVSSALPKLTQSVTINGPVDSAGHPEVELTPTTPGTVASGLEADAAGVTIKGLSIVGFSGAGIVLAGGTGTVQGDYLGIGPTGTSAIANDTGLVITSNGNFIAGNVISGNAHDGVDVSGDSNTFQGNFIGTDATGTIAVENRGSGIVVNSASNTVIGGASASARNIISGNNLEGVLFTNDSLAGNLLEGNYLGLDVTGKMPLGNQDSGVDLESGNLISILDNAISDSAFDGIYINNSSSNVIGGNFIGTDAAGNAANLPYGNAGIALFNS
ncbi:MAG TPA: hypothetical protein VK797_15525, partial [Tepidisphaeraceae bacterium]|nr:hypothetical protein [Tepidisphaeraceae bacterium]